MPVMIRKNDRMARIANAIMQQKPRDRRTNSAKANGIVGQPPTGVTRTMMPN